MTQEEYEATYRKLHPRGMTTAPYSERQRQLTDLWPRDQEEFKRMVDAVQCAN